MTSNDRIVDLIERANDAQRVCACGSHTRAVWRDGVVWLECAARAAQPTGRLERLARGLTAATHVLEPIIDVAA